MATPTKSAQIVIDSQGEDFVQLVKSSGGIVSWIDNTGAPQGALAAGIGANPGGTNTAIQFNDNSAFGGQATDGTGEPATVGISWDKTTGVLNVVNGPGTLAQILGGPNSNAAFQIDNSGSPAPTAVIVTNDETLGTLTLSSDGLTAINSSSASVQIQDQASNPMIEVGGTAELGFYGATIITKPTVTGAKAGNAALTSLIAQLVALGLITDGTS